MILRLGIGLFLSLCSSVAFAAMTVTYNETIPRNVAEQNYFDLEIKIREIIPTRNTPAEFFSRLKFFLPKESEFAGGEITPNSERYSVSITQESISEPSSVTSTSGNTNFDGTVFLRVSGRSQNIAALLGDNKYIDFRVDYKDPVTNATENQEFKGETKKLNLLVHVAKAAPTFEAVGAHKRIDVDYSIPSSIAFTEGESAPTGIYVVAIPHESNGLVLPAFRHEPAEKSDVAGDFCVYTQLENGGDCISCAEDGQENANFYLNIKAIKELAGVKVKPSNDVKSTSLSILGLSPEQKYSVFAVYQPDGVVRSTCAVTSATVNLTLSELNGESEAKQADPQCFVATAAYGTPMHHRIDQLRWFRDRYLKMTLWGRAFVRTYYEYAPPLAAFVARHEWLKSAVRLVLDPLTSSIEWWRGQSPDKQP